MSRYFPTALLLLSCGWALQAEVLVGPFLPGTGNWNVLPSGGFEYGPQTIRTANSYAYKQDVFYLNALVSGAGTASTSPVAAEVGSLGALIQPGTFNGIGVALSYDGKLQVNVQYVLSAFIRRPTPDGSLAHIYIDNGGNQGDHQVFASAATSEWQFVWGVYSVSATGLTPRIVMDTKVGPNDVLYVDEFAATPLSQFHPPVAGVPEPAVTWSLLGMTLPAFLVRKWIRRALPGARASHAGKPGLAA